VVARLCASAPRTRVRKSHVGYPRDSLVGLPLIYAATLWATVRMAITGIALSFVAQRTKNTWQASSATPRKPAFFLNLVKVWYPLKLSCRGNATGLASGQLATEDL